MSGRQMRPMARWAAREHPQVCNQEGEAHGQPYREGSNPPLRQLTATEPAFAALAWADLHISPQMPVRWSGKPPVTMMPTIVGARATSPG